MVALRPTAQWGWEIREEDKTAENFESISDIKIGRDGGKEGRIAQKEGPPGPKVSGRGGGGVELSLSGGNSPTASLFQVLLGPGRLRSPWRFHALAESLGNGSLSNDVHHYLLDGCFNTTTNLMF